MRAVWRKSLHDVRVRWKSFLFLFVVLGLLSGLLNVALSTTIQGLTVYPALVNQLNGADIWLQLTPQGIQAYDDGQLKLSHVTKRGPRHAVMEGVLSHDSFKENARLIAYLPEQPPIDQIRVTSGRYLSNSDPNGILLDTGLQSSEHWKVGDQVTLTIGGSSHTFTIRGFDDAPFSMPYPHMVPTPILLTPYALMKLAGGQWSAHEDFIGVQVAQPQSITQIRNIWEQQMKPTWFSMDLDRVILANAFQSVTMLPAVFLIVFVLFAVFASWMICGSLVFTTVLEQSRDIAILRSLGFTRAQLRRVYVLQNLAVSLVASLVGILVSRTVIAHVAVPVVQSERMSRFVPYQMWIWAIDVVVLLLIVFLSSYLPARRAGRVAPTQALRFGAERPRTYGSGLFDIGVRMRLPFTASLTFRDLFARPFRTLAAFVSILFTVSTITFALAVVTSIQGYVRNPSVFGQSIDVEIQPGKVPLATVNQALQAEKGVKGYLSMTYDNLVALRSNGQKFELRALASSTGHLPYIIQQGREIEHPNEIIAAKGMLDLYGLRVGDTIHLSLNGQSIQLHIVGRFFDLNNEGREVIVGQDTLGKIMPSAKVTWYGVELQDYHQSAGVAQELQQTLGKRAVVKADSNAVPPEGTEIQTMMSWFSVVLGSIALLSLFNTLFRSVLERIRDFGILKSLGMRPGQIFGNVILTGGIISVAASAIGIPVGIVLLKVVMQAVSNLLGSGVFPLTLPWGLLGIVIGSIVVVSVGVSLVPAVRASYVRPVEVLRAE